MPEHGSTGSILTRNLRTPGLTIDLDKVPYDVRVRFPEDASTTEVRQPHNLYHDDGRGERIIVEGSHWIHPPLDGFTVGRRATDRLGRDILDANGDYTLVQTGLLRSLALDGKGKILQDADGHICFSDIGNPQEGFDTSPSQVDPRIFLSSWHPATQIEYIIKHNKGPKDNSFIYTSIGSGKDKITACITSDLKSVYIAETLQTGDVMGMTREDQENLIKLPDGVFELEIKTKLGLVTLDEAKAEGGLYHTIEKYINTMEPEKPPSGAGNEDYYMNEEKVNLYKDQLKMLLEDLEKRELVNTSAVNDEREDITKRYEMAKAFSLGATDVHPEHSPTVHVPPQHVRSQDHGKSIKETFTKLITHERSILQQTQALKKLQRDSSKYDLPVFVAIYQTAVHRIMEVKNSVSTEVADQINDLIGIYTRMQNIINKVSGTFKTKSGDHDPEEYSIGGGSQGSSIAFPGNLGHPNPSKPETPANDSYIVAMFEKDYRSLHPIEKFYKISRPDFNNIESSTPPFAVPPNMPSQQKTSYDAQSTQLSGTINILNQKAQSLLNKISSIENKSSKHFELANNALSKMHDLVLTIARNVV